MSDTVRVALLFEDDHLAAPLREALREGGARIVHEGPLSGASRAALRQSGAEVVVINLHDEDDSLTGLDELIDGEQPRVVFNDAAATQRLDGWDRARWARHLAAKVLAHVDVDPPRPRDALGLQMPQSTLSGGAPDAELVPPSVLALMSGGEPSENLATELERLLAAEQDVPLPSDEHGPSRASLALDDGETMMSGEAWDQSATLAEELAGLLAQETEQPSPQEDYGRGPAFDPAWLGAGPALDNEPPMPAATTSAATLESPWGAETPAVASSTPAREPSRFTLDHLQLVALEDPSIQPRRATATDDNAVRQAPAEWSLLDDDAPAPPSASVASSMPVASSMGIESLIAADRVPSVDTDASPSSRSGLSLELVARGEAIEPPASRRLVHSEMVLDTEAAALRWLVVLGAAADATPAVAAFLAALPVTLPVLLVHTQHHQDSSALLRELSANSALPVRLAAHGSHATRGEVLLVPPGQRVSLRRDGRVELLPDIDAQPSIDASLSMAAQVFGAAALAIVFSGRGNDAVAGAQAVHDSGGRVWVEEVIEAPSSDMVRGVQVERLADFAGTPAQLAARLSEEYSMEIRR
ncbi:MAG: chemotaxis protein CheB [Dyella sp.]